ncbi:aldo/keto reductase [Pontiellaceae bacterium B12227]|nr:aldo/keto reductase [Pontiellaceae bacterium B12227]
MINLPKDTFLVLGSGTFGLSPDEATAFQMMDFYRERGGRVLDTARCYPPPNEGLSEEIIGRWLKARGCRDDFLISTKGGHPPMDQLNRPRLSAEELTHDIEKSRLALGVDCIDLYWLHRDDETRPVEELLHTGENFRERGWVRHYGASNFSVTRLKEAAAVAMKNGWEGFSANQPMACIGGRFRKPMEIPLLTVLDEVGERYHRETGLPLMPYTSQAAGYYEKVVRLGTDHPSLAEHPFNTEGCNRIAGKLKALSDASGHSVSALVLALWKTKDYPVYPLIGCRTMEQLDDCFQSLEVDLHTIHQLSLMD